MKKIMLICSIMIVGILFSSTNIFAANEGIASNKSPTVTYKDVKYLSDKDLLDFVKDKNNSNDLKMLYIQNYALNTNKKGRLNQQFIALLEDKDIDDSVKIAIISSLNFNSADDTKILKNIAKSKNVDLSIHALKKLSAYDTNETLAIATGILDNYKNEDSRSVQNALSVYSSAFLHKDVQISKPFKDTTKFKALCISLLDNELYADAAAFALGNIFDDQGVSAIINHKKIENSTKVYIIDQCYSLLLDKVHIGMSDQELKTVITAMNILPINEFYEPLKKVMYLKQGIYSQTLYNEYESIIQKIKNEGINANSSRAQ